jgi:hypothetical protein
MTSRLIGRLPCPLGRHRLAHIITSTATEYSAGASAAAIPRRHSRCLPFDSVQDRHRSLVGRCLPSMRLPADPTDRSWRTRRRRTRGKSAVDCGVVDAMAGHPSTPDHAFPYGTPPVSDGRRLVAQVRSAAVKHGLALA